MSQKVSAAELKKAQQQIQQQMYMGMPNNLGFLQLLNQNPQASMLNTQMNVPLAQNPYQMQQGFGNPMGNPGLTAQQQQAYLQQVNIPNPAGQNAKGTMLGSKSRLGVAKQRMWGQCKNCAKMEYKNYVDDKGDVKMQCKCLAKQIVVDPEDGIKYVDIMDEAGKKVKSVDATESCRIFTPNKKPAKI